MRYKADPTDRLADPADRLADPADRLADPADRLAGPADRLTRNKASPGSQKDLAGLEHEVRRFPATRYPVVILNYGWKLGQQKWAKLH